MVWTKFKTLNSTYGVEDLQTGYSATASKTWLYEQVADIREVLNTKGWDNQVDSGATQNSDYRNDQWASPLLTDLWTGAQKRYRYYMQASRYKYFGSSDRDPYYWSLQEDRNYDGSTGFDPFYSSGSQNMGADGGDYYATGKIQYWESDEAPQSLLVTTGGGYPIFWWPGFTECYFYEAQQTDDYRWQNTIYPAGTNTFTAHAGNPQNNYGNIEAQVLPQRMSTGAGTTSDMPGATSLLYTDFWWINDADYQPLFKQPTSDVIYYRPAPTGGGFPNLSTTSSASYKGYSKFSTVLYNNEYYGSWRNFWFNFGSSVPDFESDFVEDAPV